VKKEDTANNNINGNTTVNIDVKLETNSVTTKEKSWSPEAEEENQTTVVNENNVKTETPKGSLESIHNDNNDGKTSSGLICKGWSNLPSRRFLPVSPYG